MKTLKKLTLFAALTIPCSFAMQAEAQAFEKSNPESATFDQDSISTIPNQESYVNQDYTEGNTLEQQSKNQKVAEFIIVSAGVAMAVGSVVLLANSLDKKRRPDSIERVRLLQPQNSPIGPEDDPNFWPPKTYEN